jgi:GNAT superfamily N-acetyltransferase
MYNFVLNKVSNHVNKVTMLNFNNIYGHSTYSVHKRKAVIHFLFINKKYRGNDLGSVLLQNTEKILFQNNNINKISLLAHEKQGSSGLIDLYLKNGYFENFNANNEYYDDGIDIYTLIPMYKLI